MFGLIRNLNLVARLYLLGAITTVQDGNRFRLDPNYPVLVSESLAWKLLQTVEGEDGLPPFPAMVANWGSLGKSRVVGQRLLPFTDPVFRRRWNRVRSHGVFVRAPRDCAVRFRSAPEEMHPAVLNELRLLLSSHLDSRHLLTVVLSGDGRLIETLCFYLDEVERRGLYRQFCFANTRDYARERFGLERRKTQTLLYMARRFADLPLIEARFRSGDLPWTKVREILKVATKETEAEWLDTADRMTNRQLEDAVRDKLPAVNSLMLKVLVNDERAETWVQVKESFERRAGKELSVVEVFDLLCAEALCNYAATPPFGPPDPSPTVVMIIKKTRGGRFMKLRMTPGAATLAWWRSGMGFSARVPVVRTVRFLPEATSRRAVEVARTTHPTCLPSACPVTRRWRPAS